MPEAVDRVEGRIDLIRQAEVGHVPDHHARGLAVTKEATVAILDGPGIEIQARNLVARLSQTENQASRATSRFEEVANLAGDVCVEGGKQEIELRLPVRTKYQVVVAGVVVEIHRSGF